MTTQYQKFVELTDETYQGCTTEQRLGVYIQHRPANVVPFLLELITALHPELVEEHDDAADTD